MAAATGFVIALLGAESTGKTTLAHALRAALAGPALAELTLADPALGNPSLAEYQRSVTVVPEYLREFCDRHQRTPRQDEQAHIAAEQTRRIAAAARDHAIVIADTTALMTAVYSEHVFGDASLYPGAQADHARCNLTLLTALDLPWQADGLQRDGAHVRDPVDALVRAALGRAGAAYSVIFGSGAARLEAALACVQRALAPGPDRDDDGDGARWRWHCERCGDAQCEGRERQRLLPSR